MNQRQQLEAVERVLSPAARRSCAADERARLAAALGRLATQAGLKGEARDDYREAAALAGRVAPGTVPGAASSPSPRRRAHQARPDCPFRHRSIDHDAACDELTRVYAAMERLTRERVASELMEAGLDGPAAAVRGASLLRSTLDPTTRGTAKKAEAMGVIEFKRVKERFKELGVNTARLGALLGVHPRTVRRFAPAEDKEHTRVKIDAKLRVKILGVLRDAEAEVKGEVHGR